MSLFSELWKDRAVKVACIGLGGAVQETLREAVAIQQVAAPTFGEHERARFVYGCFQALGLADVWMDEDGNVYGHLSGRERGAGLLVSAHLDTVFPAGTDLTVRKKPGRLYGPGIGDNSLAVAGLLRLAACLAKGQPRRDVWFVANVGEEGLGNLNGMWTVVRRLRARLGAVVVLEGGAYGSVIHRAIGVERRRIVVEAGGGHSWSDFGKPSAIHELCRIGTAIAALKVPKKPRTSYNLGMIEGGTSINTIAPQATALLDLRSEEPKALKKLASKVDGILRKRWHKEVKVRSELIGERPAGAIPATHPLVRAALDSLKALGYRNPLLRAASTDANVPLALGIPTVCIGLSVGHNAHRVDEYIEVAPLKEGLQHCYLVVLAALQMI